MADCSLVLRSRHRVMTLYFLFLCCVGFGCYVFYWSFVRDILWYPEFRTLSHYQLQWNYQPKMLTLFLLILYFLTCSLVCSMYVIAKPLVTVCWSHLRIYCPIRLKRRTFCFCNIARRRLEKILLSLYHTQRCWEPLTNENLPEETTHCISLIQTEAGGMLRIHDYILVGSSAEGLGKSYILDLKNSYSDQWQRFLLRFFCCCLPCNTSFTCLRTDIDIILRYVDETEPHTAEGIRARYPRSRRVESVFLPIECLRKPGFVNVMLRPEASEHLRRPWQQLCVEVMNNTYLSASRVRQAVYRSVDSIDERSLPASRIFGPLKHPPNVNLEVKGPAVKLELTPIGQVWYWNENQKFVIFEADLVFGIHCRQEWPKCAQSWASRKRYWPSREDVGFILNSGFILVAKSSKSEIRSQSPEARSDLHLNDSSDLEWSLSFPHSETYLGQRLPEVAKACYLAVKIIFKDHLSYLCEGLKTYQLKTVLFWELEKHPLSFWRVDNISKCFYCLLESFACCVKRRECLSYWIDGLNLFSHCSIGELDQVSAVLDKVIANPAPHVEDLGSMWC